MPYRITNRTNETLLVRLLSGRTLHLAGGASTEDLDGAEINGNARLSSLSQRRLITVEESADSRSPAPAKTASRPSSGQRSRRSDTNEEGEQ